MWFDWLQIFIENYGSLVHIHTVEFEANIAYFSTFQIFSTLVLEVPENGMWRLEPLGVKTTTQGQL